MVQRTLSRALPCDESCARDAGFATRKSRRPILGRSESVEHGVQLRRTEGHTEALAPQDYADERVDVGIVGHTVIGATPVGA